MQQLQFATSEDDTRAFAENLDGFERFYPLLRVLVATQEEKTFYYRLHLLLTLARWTGDPPTVTTLARTLDLEEETLSQTLGLLRRAGWLVSGVDDFRYTLTPHGRILIVLMQLLAQPWEDDDVTAFAAQLYEAAEGLDIQQDLLAAQFDIVLSTLEDRVRQTERAYGSENTDVVRSRLQGSTRDVKIAKKALQLRQQGAVGSDDYNQIQRVHTAISQLSAASAQLNTRYQKLVARDLLAQGGVTFGDILAWARDAELDELAGVMEPHVQLPYRALWSASESVIVDAGLEVAGQTVTQRSTRVPEPAPLADPPSTARLDDVKQRMYRTQEELRRRLRETDPLPLAQWVDESDWGDAVVHFLAALDPELARSEDPVYVELHSRGELDCNVAHVEAVTAGSATRE